MKTSNIIKPIGDHLKHLALGLTTAAAFFTTGPTLAAAGLITPVAATAQSFYGGDDRAPVHAIDGSDMTPNSPVTASSTTGTGTGGQVWLSNGNQDTWITFDLGSVQTIAGFHLWNYNENSGNPATFTRRGVKTAGIYAGTSLLADGASYASAGAAWGTLVQNMTFTQAPGAGGYAGEDYLLTTPVTTRYLQIYVTSNFGPPGDGYTGISEIRFIPPATPATILSFGANVAGSSAVIGTPVAGAAAIAWTVPYGTVLANLAPTYTLTSGTCDRISGAVPSPDFGAGPVTYTVTDGGTINVYTVTVTVDGLIRATAATAQSYYGGDDRAPVHAIDGSGMTPNNPVTASSTSGTGTGGAMWLSDGNHDTWITFDLGSVQTIAGFHLWNYNEANLTFVGRGVHTAGIYAGASLLADGASYASAGAAWGTLVQNMTFTQAPGTAGYAGENYLFTTPVTTRYIQIFVTSNFGTSDDYTGISEIVFIPLIPPGTPPTVSSQPQSLIVSLGENASFSVEASGSPTLTYQWRKDGAVIAGANAATLALSGVTRSAEAGYSVVVTNDSGSVTSAVARLTVFETIATLFNTGLDGSHVALADGLSDPHYQIITNADGAPISAIVEDSTVFPIVPGVWLLNTASSKWVGPRFNTAGAAGLNAGNGIYVYRTTFDLSDRDASTVIIQGRWATDNLGVQIRLNGVDLGLVNTAQYTVWTTFTIDTNASTFLPGVNTIDFVVQNVDGGPGYTGLRVEFTASNARFLPNIPPRISLQPVSQTAVVESNSVTFSVSATGSDPLTFQWSKDGTPLPGQTNLTLTILSATTSDNGFYTVLASNNSGSTNSNPAQLAVIYRRVPGIYGTGVNADGTLAADSSIDLHWIIGSSADQINQGPDAIVINQAGSPVPPWLDAGPKSKWIAPQPNQSSGNAEGNYTYQTFFDLTGADVCTFRLTGQFAVDNSIVDVLVNGVSQGVSGGGFTSFQAFTLTNGFVTGPNSVDFIMNNAGNAANPTALRVDLEGFVSVIAPVLSITSTSYDANNERLTLIWNSIPGATYTIEGTQVFGNGVPTVWDNVITGIGSGGKKTSNILDAPFPGTFYRIKQQ